MNETERQHDDDCGKVLGLMEKLLVLSKRMKKREIETAVLCNSKLTYNHISAKSIQNIRARRRDFRERSAKRESATQ